MGNWLWRPIAPAGKARRSVPERRASAPSAAHGRPNDRRGPVARHACLQAPIMVFEQAGLLQASATPASPFARINGVAATEPSHLGWLPTRGVRSIVRQAVLASRGRVGLTLPQGPRSPPGVYRHGRLD